MSEAERDTYRQQHEWGWLEEDEAACKDLQKDIDLQSAKFTEDLRNRRDQQVRLGLALSRFSPASSYQLAAMTIAGTDVDLKTRYENAMQAYRQVFNAYKDKKAKEAGGGGGGIRITVDSERGFSFSAPREAGALDLSDMPRFTVPAVSLHDFILPALADCGLLIAAGLLVFGGSVLAFLRYDLR